MTDARASTRRRPARSSARPRRPSGPGVTHDGSIAHRARAAAGARGQRSRRRLALAPGARSRARCAETGIARFAATRPGRAVHPPTAPSFETADERYVWLTRVGSSRRAPSLIEPAPVSGLAQRPRRRGPAGRRAVRRRLPASRREPPAFRRGDRVVRRFAHALRLRGALASPARSPCWHAPAPCGHAPGRPTDHSGSP